MLIKPKINKDVIIQFRAERELVNQLIALAKKEEVTLSEICRALLTLALTKVENKLSKKQEIDK